MNPEKLYEKYQQLLEENQLLRNRIASLEATLKNAGVSLVEEGATKYFESKPTIIGRQIAPATRTTVRECWPEVDAWWVDVLRRSRRGRR